MTTLPGQKYIYPYRGGREIYKYLFLFTITLIKHTHTHAHTHTHTQFVQSMFQSGISFLHEILNFFHMFQGSGNFEC